MRVRVRARVRVRVAAGLTEPTWLSPWLLSARTVQCVGGLVRWKCPPAVPMIETRMMLGSVLGIAVARPLQARSAAPRMVISASPTIAEYPSPALSPWDVVASQISALQAEDSAPHPKPTALWRRPARLELTRVPCRGRRAHLSLRIARGQAHDGKDEAHGGAFPSQPFRLPVASPSRPLVGATRL